MGVELPKNFVEFEDVRKEGFLRMKRLKEEGRSVVGTFCQYTPSELIDAAGLCEVGLCGRSAEAIPSAERDLPGNLCPLIKASYGHVLDKTCPYAFFSDLVMGETTCDGKKKMYEMLGRLKPMHVIHLPNVPDTERSLLYWRMEIEAFKEKLEESFDLKISEEAIRRAIRRGNRERRLMARLYELGRYDPPAITGLEMRSIMDGSQFIFDKEERFQKTEAKIEACEAEYRAGRGPYSGKRRPLRILISGAGLGGTEDKIIGAIERAGAAVVCYEGCCGISSRRRLIDESLDKDPILAIAEKYLEVPCAVMSPNERRMEQVRSTIDEWKIDGVISVNLHSCNPFGIEARNIGKTCEEKNVPHMKLETDFYPNDREQLKTRIEAFLELLESRKRGGKRK